MLSQFKEELRSVATKERAKTNEWFFKTGKGKYGEGDTFLGIRMPDLRKIVKRHLELSFVDIQELINSPFHEERMAGLLVLVYQYEKNKVEKKAIAEFYLKNTKKINNWDLVDCSSPQTLGLWLVDRDTSVLYKLAKSLNLWERRIAIITTFAFIRANKFDDTIKISEILLQDKHDLIHKAVGWMLREVGKRDESVLLRFLDKHYKEMPRTCLRYAIERLSKEQKVHYMKK